MFAETSSSAASPVAAVPVAVLAESIIAGWRSKMRIQAVLKSFAGTEAAHEEGPLRRREISVAAGRQAPAVAAASLIGGGGQITES